MRAGFRLAREPRLKMNRLSRKWRTEQTGMNIAAMVSNREWRRSTTWPRMRDIIMTTTRHPNTVTLLSAWERMHETPDAPHATEKASDHPELLECLFVVERSEEGRWLFRNAGNRLGRLLGRDLGQQDCLDFWTGHDRIMVESLIDSVRESRKPGTLHATGETLTGTQVNIELTFAPLPSPRSTSKQNRLLGLYQVLEAYPILQGRPVWRHRVTALFPPVIERQAQHLRLVASND